MSFLPTLSIELPSSAVVPVLPIAKPKPLEPETVRRVIIPCKSKSGVVGQMVAIRVNDSRELKCSVFCTRMADPRAGFWNRAGYEPAKDASNSSSITPGPSGLGSHDTTRTSLALY